MKIKSRILKLRVLSGHFKVFKKFILPCIILPFSMCVNNKKDDGPTVSISMKAIVGLQYDIARFNVKPGSRVKLTLTNVSDMSHNLVITKPGMRLDIVNSAQELVEKGPQMNYTPDIEEVLWSIPVVSPGQTKSVTFTAPKKPGVYPYVCTYPGHGFSMYGAMYVTQDDKLPPVGNDMNIPESRRRDNEAGATEDSHLHDATVSPHPYALKPPYLYHVFIEGATPSAIAVHLPNDLSYCWDAGDCRLGFAWQGGFLDMSDLWKGHFDASAKVLGDIFFRDNTDYPIRLGENAMVPFAEYKGYRLVERYPEFHYALNGIDVYELIRPKPDSIGLIRVFRIPHAAQKVSFFINRQDDAIEYKSSTGNFKNRKLELSPSQAKEFTITMTSYNLAYKNKD